MWAATASARSARSIGSIGQDVADGGDHRLDLLERDVEGVLPGASRHRSRVPDATTIRARSSGTSRWSVPRIDHAFTSVRVVGERVLDVGRPETVDPRGELELGRARDLGVDADHLADDVEQAIGRRSLDDMLLVQAIGHHLLPRDGRRRRGVERCLRGRHQATIPSRETRGSRERGSPGARGWATLRRTTRA